MEKKIRWGIMGPGRIAHKFVQSLKCIQDAEITAVGSTSTERAAEFAAQYGIGRSFGSYRDFAADPDIDIVYIATQHPGHFECALICLKAGKAVLCEKPFTINAGETEILIRTARESKQFLMEAMWMRYLPAIVEVRELLVKGVIGEIRMIKADFGNRTPWDPEGRLLNPASGGGALLDVGIYPVSFSSMIFGASPTKIASVVHLGATGVDEQFSALLGYAEGRIAVLSGAVRTALPNEARVIGTEGYIRIPHFWYASGFELNRNGRIEQFDVPFLSTGYLHEAEEAMRCLRAGLTESSVMPLDESLKIMKILDTLRAQWGLRYPSEINLK
jgi:dihydrodiol dehydrogenase / D-xylose 1-dehydrogenase (NADP)